MYENLPKSVGDTEVPLRGKLDDAAIALEAAHLHLDALEDRILGPTPRTTGGQIGSQTAAVTNGPLPHPGAHVVSARVVRDAASLRDRLSKLAEAI